MFANPTFSTLLTLLTHSIYSLKATILTLRTSDGSSPENLSPSRARALNGNLIPELNDEDVEEDLKLDLFKMNYEKNPKFPLQLAYDLSDEKKKLELALLQCILLPCMVM